MKQLPIGISTLSAIRENDMVYIDKTALILPMVQKQGRYFLSRPRRFGKSLLVDTFKQLFEGNKALFAGLAIEQQWDWSQTYPVIKLDFADGHVRNRDELDQRLQQQLSDIRHDLKLPENQALDLAGNFSSLIRQAEQEYSAKVVILIDEYDKAILDNIEGPQQAAEIREGLKNFYSVMKAQDGSIQFIFMTGVTKFSKVSLFSGINHIQDISLHSRYSTLCGYSQTELEQGFADHLQNVDWQKLKHWYNGYHFCGEAVYNPYDILLFIDNDYRYRNYWFESGNPSFLLKLFQHYRYFLPALEQVEVGEEILNSFDIEKIDPITLLFQSGYLTIESSREKRERWLYQLKVPNQEVRQALNDHFINAYTEQLPSEKMPLQDRLYDCLFDGDLEGLQSLVTRLFAGIPWRNFTGNHLPESEGYYASVLYAFFASLNAVVIPEDITNHGQADLTVILGNNTYVMEFKRDHSTDYQTQTPNPALEQLQQRGYAEKYGNTKQSNSSVKKVFEVGMIFNSHARNLVQMDWREL